MTELNLILAFFASLGFSLEFLPAEPAKGDDRDMYVYDGGVAGTTIQAFTGMNGLHKPAFFCLIDLPDGQSFDYSGSMDGWLEGFREPLTALLKDAPKETVYETDPVKVQAFFESLGLIRVQ